MSRRAQAVNGHVQEAVCACRLVGRSYLHTVSLHTQTRRGFVILLILTLMKALPSSRGSLGSLMWLCPRQQWHSLRSTASHGLLGCPTSCVDWVCPVNASLIRNRNKQRPWLTPVIPALELRRQEDCREFQVKSTWVTKSDLLS